jgi:tRNA modification GTPase
MGRDTIFAVSSGAPPAGIAIIRISGPAAGTILAAVAGVLPAPRLATLRRLRDRDGALIDQALILWFPGPATVSGEDLAELHLHGGRAVVARMLAVLSEIPMARAAEAGEFTRRAFLNGRIDLLEAEALGDLLSAETEYQRRAALAMADGTLGRIIDPCRQTALRLAALVEASLDFGDEDDVAAARVDIAAEARTLARTITDTLAAPSVERLRDGIVVVLAGPPNAGKSSLLNALVQRDAAIVSPLPGTTRDVVDVPVTIAGVPFLFSDTAGLRESEELVERIGIDRARDRIARTDLLLWLGDEPPPSHPNTAWLFPRRDIRLHEAIPNDRMAISTVTGEGMDALGHWLRARATLLLPQPDGVALSRRQRQELALAAAAADDAASITDLVLQAEALRRLCAAFDRLTGKAGFEDVLDVIFGQFCLGK